MRDPLIQQFVAYIARRGIPEQFHELYRNEAAAILSLCGVSTLEQLDQAHIELALRDVERRMQNRKAVCAALEAFIERRDQQGGSIPPTHLSASPAVTAPSGAQHRRFVRVPFNREIDVVGSLGGNRASDISMGGIYLETRSAWRVGDTVDLNFRLRPAEPPIHVSARVVYVDPGVGAGLDFIDPPAEVRGAIRHYVESSVARREHR